MSSRSALHPPRLGRRLTTMVASGALALTGLVAVAAPSAQALAPAPVAYVADLFNNNVRALDTSTNTVTATIPVGNGPTGVTVSPIWRTSTPPTAAPDPCR